MHMHPRPHVRLPQPAVLYTLVWGISRPAVPLPSHKVVSSMATPRIFLLVITSSLFCFLSQATKVTEKQCFYPNGVVAKDSHPCDLTAEENTCCSSGLGNVCLSNKLCANGDGHVVRGACTDANWLSPACAYYCMSMKAKEHLLEDSKAY